MTHFKTRKSDKQVFPVRQKSGSSKANISPQPVGVMNKEELKKIELEEKNQRFFMQLEKQTDLPAGILESELSDDEIKKLKKFDKFTYTMHGGEDWDEKDSLVFAKEVAKFKKQGYKRIANISGPENEVYGIWAKGKAKDSDKDGVSDFEDCEPNNPKKQGIMHDGSRAVRKANPHAAKKLGALLESKYVEYDKAKKGFTIKKTTDPVTGTKGVYMPVRSKSGRPVYVGRGEPDWYYTKRDAIDATYEYDTKGTLT